MPIRTKNKTVKRDSEESVEAGNISSEGRESLAPFSHTSGINARKIVFSKKIVLVVITAVVILGLLGYLFKDKFIVAIVNGKPIFRYELSKRIFATYGKETLENLIIENLIKSEVKKAKVNVSEAEVNNEISKISSSLGAGTKIEDVLKLQGMTLKDLQSQILLKLQVNKLLEKEIIVTDEEVNTFIKNNSQSLTATGEAERKIEATELVKSQKISEKIQTWIQDLLTKANITRFLK